MIQSALPQPPRSSLRKMSEKTVISSQIQIKKRKNQKMTRRPGWCRNCYPRASCPDFSIDERRGANRPFVADLSANRDKP